MCLLLVLFDATSSYCLLYAYGSYGMPEDPDFDANRLIWLDRGVVYVIAHIRGGGEMGRQWYESGKFLHKKNTFWYVCSVIIIFICW